MSEKREAAYETGHRAAQVAILSELCRSLGYDDPEVRKLAWIKEREAAIASLRSLCAEFGDNEWTPDLHLQDVIEKHLADHLLK